MTNKLPVVGKRYRSKYCNVEIIVEKPILFQIKYGTNSQLEEIRGDEFFDYFKELPEDKAETKPEIQNSIPENVKITGFDDSSKGGEPFYITKNDLSPEVKEAMENLSKAINYPLKNDPLGLTSEEEIIYKCGLLLNALDKQFNLNGYFEGLPPSKEAIDRHFKVNETSESVGVKEEEVREIKPCQICGFDERTKTIPARGQKACSKHFPDLMEYLSCNEIKAENLLNALEKQFKVNETSESVGVKEEEVNKISCGYNPLPESEIKNYYSELDSLKEEWQKNNKFKK